MDAIQNEKENANIKRVQRTKKDQFDLIFNFFKVNNESLMASDEFQKKWSELVVILNSVGPPVHSCSEWRRVWSDRKYNNKRKRLSLEGSSESTKRALVVPTDMSVENVLNDQSNIPVSTDLIYSPLGDLNEYLPYAEGSFNNDNLLYDQVNETNVLSENTIETSIISDDNNGVNSGVEPIQRNFVDKNTSPLGDLNYYFIPIPNVVNSNSHLQYNDTIIDTSNRKFNDSTADSGQSTTDSGKPIEFALQSQNNLSNEISSKLSDLLKRLDVIIRNQIETINLLKELGKLK